LLAPAAGLRIRDLGAGMLAAIQRQARVELLLQLLRARRAQR